MKKKISVKRTTTESKITVNVDFGGTAPDYRSKISTPIAFLSHMIEHIAYRGNVTIETQIELDKFDLTHVVCEDLGQTMGKAFLDYINYAKPFGVSGFGGSSGIIDEALARVVISFENRAYFNFSSNVKIQEMVEGAESADIITFLEGFCQGALCTMHVDVLKGENPHHIFESVYRALGTCIKEAFRVDEGIKGKTAGVAGSIDYDAEIC